MRRSLFLLSTLLLLGSTGRAQATVSDPLFTESTFVSAGLGGVTGMAWAPDGSDRLFVLTKAGEVRIIAGGQLLPEPFFTFPQVYTNSECGLLGMTFDPDFGTSGRVYFFVTVSSSKQQIVRLTASGNVGTSPTVVVDNLPTAGNNHDGGAIGFGPDGKLYWGIGDLGNGTGVDADLTSLAAKLGRANVIGTPANDNPFFDGVGPNNEYVWARGFRNPFTLTQQPSTGRLWVNSVGTSYEQIFVPTKGSHAGYNDYEINQPTGNAYQRPVLWYRTNGVDTRTLASASRAGGVATFTTSANSYLVKGQKVLVSGVSNASLNGTFYVASAPTPTTFTVTSPGPDVTGNGGSVSTDNLGGSIVGGTFWESSSLSAAYRGNYFFGDYNSGNLVRVQVDAGGDPSAVDVWGSGMASFIDADVGPDGDLYTVTYNATVRRIRPNAAAQALVVTPLHRWMKEGGVSVVTVRLAQAPSAPVTVTATHSAGDTDVTVTAGSSLTFTPDSWQVPQVIRIGAGFDADTTNDVATITLAAAGLPSENVTVHVADDNSPALVVTPLQVSVNEGGTATFQVALSSAPTTPVTVTVAPSGGDPDVTITSGASLVFTSQTWSTPQTVTVAAAADDDLVNDVATLSLSGGTLVPRTVTVTVIDSTGAGGAAGASGSAGAGGDGAGGSSAGAAGDGGAAGDSGAAGDGGTSGGDAGTGGTDAGAAGDSGAAGAAQAGEGGMSGSSGQSGAGQAGAGQSGGSAGASGQGGAGGTGGSGQGGAGGTSGGSGQSGGAGLSGQGGTGGLSGTSGQSGKAGAAGLSGQGGAGTTGAPAVDDGDDGCGCRAAGGGSAGAASGWLAALAVVAGRLRRRRAVTPRG